MTNPEKKDGPSKKELKKLAKKAEKDAKKAANKQGGAGGSGSGPAAAAAPAVETPPAPARDNTLKLAGADGSVHSLKAMLASQVFGIPLKSGKKVEGVAHGPSLLCGDQVVMGGNGCAKAISLLSGNPLAFVVDQWCEWERTTLRFAIGNEKKLGKALESLEAALTSSKSRHIVGHKMTAADVCVLATLSTIESSPAYPPLVKAFISTHADAVKRAKDALENFGPPKVDFNDSSLLKTLENVFNAAIQDVFGDVELSSKNSLVNKTQNPKHGDYQCNAAMSLFAALKKSGSLPPAMRSPQDVSKAIVDTLGPDHPMVTDLNVTGPGFIMCRISASYLQSHLNTFLEKGHLPKPAVEKSVCVVDFSSPNIAKEMHVGHLRSTIIGEAVCRVLEFVGHDVKRVNHVGDWGTQFGMLIQYLREEFPNFHESQPNITDLTQFYKSAKQRFDESPEFKKKSQTNVVDLQGGDQECMTIWKLLCDISRGEFQKVYNRLDITVEECGESFYNEKIPPVIEEFEKAGMISIEEGGAKCVFVPDSNIPLMLQKSDGGFGYDSTDMAALKYRLGNLKAKRIIVITDFSQGDHFKMCNTAAKQIGWVTDQKLEHIGFGTVQGEDGKRFKTRSGDTVRLVDLLDEAMNRMEASLRERIAENKANITLDQVHEVAETIGYSAVKYFDLRRNPTTNYKFSYDQMLDTKGNTAVYLLYAHARLESICSKAKDDHKVDVDELLKKNVKASITHNSERNLALQLQCFTDILEATLDDLFPYHICEYLYNLSIAASDFVTQCKVLGSPEMESRLLMCRATAMAMRDCFDLLGIRYVMRI
eukprot:CAMPEP_0195287396 /NCGR_PEP_ID=MMETSP0707-20130614/4471_1 /TAXON_ID=33640 /ORGANISM="Asterionellopsis glacialis, Strain CCMP134" /LENGTH=820 /DNA_ID=CAMNT_0040347145 /DNA_START=55 /DNA_END=2517 /DNA_ORIENTATION=+